MTLPFFLRPSTKLREINLTQFISAPASSIGCIFGEFHRGPLDPTYINGIVANFTALYGAMADPKLSFAHDTGQAFLTQSSNMLVQRVVNNALHAGVHVYLNDAVTGPASIDFINVNTGTPDGYKAGTSAPTILELSADLITANSFAVSITDGVTVTAITPVVYSGSHTATMANIASAIQTTLNSFGNGGFVEYLPAVAGVRRRLAVHMPPTKTLEVVSPLITLGSTQATVSVDTGNDKRLFTVIAENPGAWGNDIGIKITGRDTGVRQRIRLVFNGKLITANSFTTTINGTAIASPVVFATDSDTTMAAIATAIQAHAAVSSAYVETVAAGRENDRSIVIIAETPGPNQLIIDSVAVTGGVSQVAVTPFNTLDGQASDGSFVLEVYNRSNVNLPEERYVVTLASNVDNKGTQTRIEAVINEASSPSINIRIIPNPRFLTDATFITDMLAATSNADLVVPTTLRWLTGGDPGLAVASSHLRQAIRNLDDRVHYPFSILMNSGYTAVEVQQEMIALCEKRIDCFAVLDMPSNRQATQSAREYRLYDMNINSSFGAIYTPDLLIADIVTGERRYIPPSGFVGATYAYNDRVASIAHAPAGLNRGILKNVLALRVNYKPGDEELLHPVGVNCIIDKPGNGPTIMGEETLEVKKSLLSSVHARRLVSQLEVSLVDGLDYVLFEPNNEFTRNQAVQLGRNFLKPYKDNGALYDFKIQCNDQNNPPEIIDLDALSYRVFLKVVRAIKGIMLDVILTRTGASFTELEAQSF